MKVKKNDKFQIINLISHERENLIEFSFENL